MLQRAVAPKGPWRVAVGVSPREAVSSTGAALKGRRRHRETVFDAKEHTNKTGYTHLRDRYAVPPCGEPLTGD